MQNMSFHSWRWEISGPKLSIKITDHFTCASANVICITCTLCKKFYINETGRRRRDRFIEHLRGAEKDDKTNACKQVAKHLNLPNHSTQHDMVVCGISLHQGSKESRKTLEQKNIFLFFKSALLTVLTNAWNHSTNLFRCFSRYQAPIYSVAPSFCL